MTNDIKSPMFGPSAVFDPATHESRSGKSALMNELMAKLAGKPDALAATIIGNCTTSIPFKFEFAPKDNGHTVMLGSTVKASGMASLPPFVRDVLLALGSLKTRAQSTGIT